MPLRRLQHLGLLVAMTALLCPRMALASLGQDVASVEADQASLLASRRVVASAQGYTVHELSAPTGTLVREFVSAQGTVFALSWRGPFLPDLRPLLGEHFEAFSEAARESTRHGLNSPFLVHKNGLFVESAGHPRAFHGRAALTDLLPAGFDWGEKR